VDVKICEKEYCDSLESSSFTAILDDRGRITIPASIRKELGIRTGSPILTRIEKILRGEK
jgi:AbrB family looped-hinge helix DNA binding protein